MEAAYTYHPAYPERTDDYMVVASRAEWEMIVDWVADYSLDLDVPVVRRLLEALESQGIRP